ncbi:MAG TPA: [Ni/Fe] hydrogenase small subunit [Caldithrix abyssi]|uniref:[Ni/Fe] hydrogenase small subunit n=1 Tax=Caldithrix abyssi TaxID=187145 RepID=A0A7V1PUL1_CALAY|nr:[Ni/Fe] hydrogenase small subunit [Caldithrix abyssi]
MPEKMPTMREAIESKGYSRRDFLRYCSAAAAIVGLETLGIPKVVRAFETKPRPPVIWLHFQECTCCSESFIRSTHPIVADVIFDYLSLDYTETLMAPSGFQAEKSYKDTITKYAGQYILLIEGSVPAGNDGVYCMIGGRSAEAILQEAARDAAAVIAWGSCASNGCVQNAKPNPTNATPIHKLIDKPVINVPGCPPIADVMTGVITHLLVFGTTPDLDSQGRPKEFYSRRVHDTCYRRPYYDAGLFVESFDDENARKGYCLYKVGCRGPVTYNACAVTRWNGGVSYPIQSGHGCIGCSENGFWDNGPFYQHLASFPGFGIESTADTVGTVIGLGAAAGVTAHAVATNIRKRRLIKKLKDESVEINDDDNEGGNS